MPPHIVDQAPAEQRLALIGSYLAGPSSESGRVVVGSTRGRNGLRTAMMA
jgi:hypothetical protein